VIGYEALGYRASMGPPGGEITPAGGGFFPTPEAAKAAAQAACPYALEWDDGFYTVNDDRRGTFSNSVGGHPRAMAQDRDNRTNWARRDRVDPDPNIMEELGHAAWWNRYYVEHVTEPVTEDIPGSEYIFGGFNIRRGHADGWWDVFLGDGYGGRVSSHPSYAESDGRHLAARRSDRTAQAAADPSHLRAA
jgi:hypothetical protein